MRGSCTGEHVCKDEPPSRQPSGTAAAFHPTGGKPAAVAQAASGRTEGSSDEGSPTCSALRRGERAHARGGAGAHTIVSSGPMLGERTNTVTCQAPCQR